MLNSAITIKLKQRINKLDSQDYDNIECWQVVEAFNKAQLEWCRRQLHGNNMYKEGDEMSKRRIDDLKQEIRRNQKIKKAAKGGLIDKPLGAGGKKSGPPPKRGPNPQGLNIKSNTVKTVKLEK